MPHLVIWTKNGVIWEVVEHDENGNRTAEPMNAKQIVKLDHAPSEITIQVPTLELTKVILKAVEKYYK